MTKLKPCPFCGGEAYVLDENEAEMRNKEDYVAVPQWVVVCDYIQGGCGARGGYRQKKATAIEVWNRRVMPVTAYQTIEQARPCKEANIDGNGKCLGYSIYEDDEPIDKCKACPKYTSGY